MSAPITESGQQQVEYGEHQENLDWGGGGGGLAHSHEPTSVSVVLYTLISGYEFRLEPSHAAVLPE